MANYKKTLVCSACGIEEERVGPTAIGVICSTCVRRRIQVLDAVGRDIFIQIFYKLLDSDGRELLKNILDQKKCDKHKGHHLKKARKARGWSQTALAGSLDVSKNTVLAMEHDKTPLSLRAVVFIQQQGKKFDAHNTIC